MSVDDCGNRSSGFASLNSLDSARVIVPLVLSYVDAGSVVDFGCKHGEWLSVFQEHGVAEVRGFDKPKRVEQGLLINAAHFAAVDLCEPITLNDRFDLAVCVEVAEHLPATAGRQIVQTLVSAAPIVLFSAATPGQGGLRHLNEQPRQYWVELFQRWNYRAIDCLRPQIWQHPDIAWWYRQNLFFFAESEAVRQWPALAMAASRPTTTDLDLVHVDRLNPHPGALVLTLLQELVRRVGRRASSFQGR